jgi:predicted dehydrogenase
MAIEDSRCGQNYSEYALYAPDRCKVVAMAEPRPKTQSRFAVVHKVDKALVFNTWQELHAASAENIKTAGKRLADAVVVAVLDSMHMEVVIAFADQGYHVLCEKPMATSLDDCIRMEESVKNAGVIFGMGHGDFVVCEAVCVVCLFVDVPSPSILSV